MSSQFYEIVNDPAQISSLQYKGSALRGALVGLIPLGLLLLVVAVTVLLTALARQLVASSGFFAQQRASVIVLIAGLVVALVVYVVAIVRTLRWVKVWQRGGASGQARATLLALGFSALVVLLPVVLAIMLPQNPAP
jgi:ABC-type bacteriocin/lantibiotic exporter with double-glycine peptidase domain